MALKITGPIEAFKEWWGERGDLRRTNGSPNRTRAQVTLRAIASDAETLARIKDNADLKLPELDSLAKWLADAWSGEGGWDTAQGIKGIEAATAVRQNQMARADPDGV